MSRHLAPPPSSVTGPLKTWFDELHRVVDALPNISHVSLSPTATPNSNVTGLSGDMVVNIGSGSTDGRLWLLGGASRAALTQLGWTALGTAGASAGGAAGGVLSGTYPNPGFAANVGDFTAGTITAALAGNATTATTAATVTSASQAAITTAANLTTIGTLVAGAVPASLVTAGTFGAGDYVFPGKATITTANALLWSADNNAASTIGAAGANRPSTGYFGTSIVTPLLSATTRVTSPLIGTTTAVSPVIDRNSVTQVTFNSLSADFAGAITLPDSAIKGLFYGRDPAGSAFSASTSPITVGSSTARGTGLFEYSIAVYRTGGQPAFRAYEAAGTYAAPATLGSGVSIGQFVIGGYDGTGGFDAASIFGITTEIWTASAHGLKWRIHAMDNGSTTQTAVLDILSTGGNPVTDNAKVWGTTSLRWSTVAGYTGDFATRVTAPLYGTTTAVDVVIDRNSVTQLTLGSLLGTFAGALVATTGFGCNSKSAQTAYASGGALAAYGAGANGFDTSANASALHAMVVSIRAALVANGTMS